MKGVMIMPMETFSIGAASKRSGLTPKMIRYMEERGWIKPLYIKIGSVRQRRFTQELVERLSEIGELRRAGYTLAAAIELAGEK